jgi:hypothetical protein
MSIELLNTVLKSKSVNKLIIILYIVFIHETILHQRKNENKHKIKNERTNSYLITGPTALSSTP